MTEQQEDTEYRVRYDRRGGHYHCRVFSRRRGQATWAKNGNLVFGSTEWESFVLAFKAEFLPEE